MIRRMIPNTLTFGNLLFGFLSVMVASQASHSAMPKSSDLFIIAGFLIVLATVFDGMDGAVARALGVQSSLGEQLDSLADLTTFGIAPAFLMYQISLYQIQFPILFFEGPRMLPLGMLIAAVYPMAAAFRLARFNIEHVEDSFSGLPSPIAGLVIALIPFFSDRLPLGTLASVITILVLAFLMISNVKYSKVTVTIRSHLTRLRIILFLFIIVSLFFILKWYFVVISFLLLYIFSGILGILFNILNKIKFGDLSS